MRTLNYIGCKKKLLGVIMRVCDENIPNMKELSFADLFSGTGVVTHGFREKVKSSIANDWEYYAYIIAKAVLSNPKKDVIEKEMEICEQLAYVNGIFSKEYSGTRMFFTEENAKKADAIRIYLEENKERLGPDNYCYLLACLLISLDKVANTTSVYGAYLKQLKKTATKVFQLTHIFPIMEDTVINGIAFNDKIENLLDVDYDIVYLDPPYNSRQYGANYCPLTYLAQYEKVLVKGKTGIINYNKSSFSSKTLVKDTFELLFSKLKFKYLIMSYNDEGLVSSDYLKKKLMVFGRVKLYSLDYNKFKASKTVKRKQVKEYVWFVEKHSESSFQELEIKL